MSDQYSLFDDNLEPATERPTAPPGGSPTPAPEAPAEVPEAPVQIEAAPTPEERAARLEAVRATALGCTRCGLSRTRTNVVFGEGNPAAPLVFVGEGPGENEDATGRPFV